MARFLSTEWVVAFNAALAGVDLPPPDPDAGLTASTGSFTVAQDVHGGPDGDVRLVLTVDAGRARVELLPTGSADGDTPVDVTVVLSFEDAAALSRGSLTPAEALNAGRIRVRGDLNVLVAASDMLAAARLATDGARAESDD